MTRALCHACKRELIPSKEEPGYVVCPECELTVRWDFDADSGTAVIDDTPNRKDDQ